MTIQRIKLRRGTAAAWTSANPTLAAGEPGYETDTGKHKIGNGATAWASLAYVVPTAAALAADSAFTSQFAPVAGSTYWVPASAMGIDGPLGGYLLDASANEGLNASVVLPSWWLTYDVYFYWYNAGAGSGNVMFVYYYQAAADGETMAPYGGVKTPGAVAAGAEDVLKITKINASPFTVSDPLINMMAYRQATHGTDTLANDVGLVGALYSMVT